MKMTSQQYLSAEREAVEKSEFINGQVVAMAGAQRSHGRISTNLTQFIAAALEGTSCETFSSDMRVAAPSYQSYFYPDIVVACDSEFEDNKQDTLVNPMVIIEILSESTEAYDRGAKFLAYRQMPALRQYVMISPNAFQIESYAKSDSGVWVLTEILYPESGLDLADLNLRIPLTRIYARVQF